MDAAWAYSKPPPEQVLADAGFASISDLIGAMRRAPDHIARTKLDSIKRRYEAAQRAEVMRRELERPRWERFAAEADRYIGLRIRTARIYAGLSQARLGAAIGLSRTQLLRIEHGKRPCTVAELLRIAIETRAAVSSFVYPLDAEIVQTGWERASDA